MSKLMHFMLVAYVCSGGRVRHSTYEGSVTFDRIFLERGDCRFAIVQMGAPPKFIVFDLYDVTQRTPYSGPITPPVTPWGIYDEFDAAVLAATLLHDIDTTKGD